MAWKYFKLEEFACKCCGRNEVKPEFVDKLDKAREFAGMPFIVLSGYRCEKHNAEVGGVPDSAHVKGLAADILCTSGVERFAMIKALLDAGFKRIGVAPVFIHVDMDYTKPSPTIWLYAEK